MQVTGNKRSGEDLFQPENKRQRLEDETYAEQFKEICERFATQANEAELKEIDIQLNSIKPHLEGKLYEKCVKKIKLTSKLLLNPTFKIHTSDSNYEINSCVLAAQSKLIKKIILSEKNSLDLSEFDSQTVDLMLMSLKHGGCITDWKLFITGLMVSEFLQAKKMSTTLKQNLMGIIPKLSFGTGLEEVNQKKDNEEQTKIALEFYNYTLNKKLKSVIESMVSVNIWKVLQEGNYLDFQRIKRTIKKTVQTPMTLNFNKTPISDAHIAHLKSLPLNGLILLGSNTSLSPQFWNAFQTFKDYKNFKTLHILNSVIAGPGLKTILSLSLEELGIPSCPRFTDPDSAYLPLTLKTLSIHTNDIGPLSCQRFGQMTQLEMLSIANCQGLTDADHQLLPLTLKSLNAADNSNLGHLACQRIAQMSSLERLNLANCGSLTDADYQLLPLTLKSLVAGGNASVGRLACQRIAQMISLECLKLANCASVTDADIQMFPLTLKILDLSKNSHLTTLAWQHISKMTALKELYLQGCNLTSSDLDLLRSSLKGCKIRSA